MRGEAEYDGKTKVGPAVLMKLTDFARAKVVAAEGPNDECC